MESSVKMRKTEILAIDVLLRTYCRSNTKHVENNELKGFYCSEFFDGYSI